MGVAIADILGGGVIGEIGNVIGKFVTTDKDKAEATRQLTELLQRPDLAQIEVNKQEAASASLFVAGWRPFIGWVCGSALAYNFIFYNLLSWGFKLGGSSVAPPPLLPDSALTEILLALLGLGSLRTVEKLKGVTLSLPPVNK